MSFKSAQSAKIGKIFKQKRLSMSITLEEVAEKTFINIEYLKGIESGDYSVFPARMFALKYYEKGINIDERGAGPDPKLHG